MIRRHVFLVLSVALASGALFANDLNKQQQQKVEKQVNQQMSEVLQGSQAEKNADTVVQDLKWYNSLADAEAEAKKTGKLVFWVHALAKLNGES